MREARAALDLGSSARRDPMLANHSRAPLQAPTARPKIAWGASPRKGAVGAFPVAPLGLGTFWGTRNPGAFAPGCRRTRLRRLRGWRLVPLLLGNMGRVPGFAQPLLAPGRNTPSRPRGFIPGWGCGPTHTRPAGTPAASTAEGRWRSQGRTPFSPPSFRGRGPAPSESPDGSVSPPRHGEQGQCSKSGDLHAQPSSNRGRS